MYRFLFFYANMIVNKNEVLNKVKLKLKLNKMRQIPLNTFSTNPLVYRKIFTDDYIPSGYFPRTGSVG